MLVIVANRINNAIQIKLLKTNSIKQKDQIINKQLDSIKINTEKIQ